jgi:hypothetical protein
MARRPKVRPLPPEGDALLTRFSDDVQEIALRLRARVLAVMPNMHEGVYDVGYTVSIVFGPAPKQRDTVVYVASFAKHVNLGFPTGAELDDPQRVLEGTGAKMRHVKFRTVDEADAAWVDGYLHDALRRAGVDADAGDGRTTVHAKEA